MIEVVIVAEARFYREALALAVRRAGLSVAASVALPTDIEPSPGAYPDRVVLLDVVHALDGPGMVHFLGKARLGSRIVALGVPERETDIVAYVEAGAAGYVPRDATIEELLCVIASAAAGEMRCSPRVAAALSRRVVELAAELPPTDLEQCLSRREEEIAQLLERGLSNQEISRLLSIAPATAKNHVHNILEKLGVRNRADAAAWIRRRRLDRTAVVRGLPRGFPPRSVNHRPHPRADRLDAEPDGCDGAR